MDQETRRIVVGLQTPAKRLLASGVTIIYPKRRGSLAQCERRGFDSLQRQRRLRRSLWIALDRIDYGGD